jgi:DNA-directed RNA polymerase specialized sigma24 family protein
MDPDQLVAQWLKETDPERADPLLETLIRDFADPVIRRIVKFKLAARQQADVDDVCGNALFNLVARLDRLKSSGGEGGVRNFRGYSAVIAYNACNEYFRARRPAWFSLSMKVRYLATHAPKFAIWETADGQEVCGFARDRGRTPVANRTPAPEAGSQFPFPGIVEAILNAARGPMVFEELVDAAADWSGAREGPAPSLEHLPDPGPSADTRLVDRNYIRRLWDEICQLSLEHRKALLLNLSDSAGGDIQLFDWLGIAGIAQIARTLEMDPLKFAELWKELPLDDMRIAQELGLSRQDVVNRRSAARKRLIRRMKELESAK